MSAKKLMNSSSTYRPSGTTATRVRRFVPKSGLSTVNFRIAERLLAECQALNRVYDLSTQGRVMFQDATALLEQSPLCANPWEFIEVDTVTQTGIDAPKDSSVLLARVVDAIETLDVRTPLNVHEWYLVDGVGDPLLFQVWDFDEQYRAYGLLATLEYGRLDESESPHTVWHWAIKQFDVEGEVVPVRRIPVTESHAASALAQVGKRSNALRTNSRELSESELDAQLRYISLS